MGFLETPRYITVFGDDAFESSPERIINAPETSLALGSFGVSCLVTEPLAVDAILQFSFYGGGIVASCVSISFGSIVMPSLQNKLLSGDLIIDTDPDEEASRNSVENYGLIFSDSRNFAVMACAGFVGLSVYEVAMRGQLLASLAPTVMMARMSYRLHQLAEGNYAIVDKPDGQEYRKKWLGQKFDTARERLSDALPDIRPHPELVPVRAPDRSCMTGVELE